MSHTSVAIDLLDGLVLTKWLRAASSREYRLAVTHSCNILKKNDASFWLIDAIRIGSLPLKEQKWTIKKLTTCLKGSAVTKVAVVVPDDLFLEAVAENMRDTLHQRMSGGIVFAIFYTYSQAHDWLHSTQEKEGLFREDIINSQPERL